MLLKSREARTGEAALGVPVRGGRRWLNAGLVLLVWLAGALIFFRAQWRGGWNLMMGNDGDSRLIVYLSEHWFQVFHGKASWLDPSFYYPVKGLLGWADTFLGFQVFYTPLRLLGCDPFLAMQLTIVLLSLVGFASFYALVRTAFGSGRVVALAFATAFTFSNTLWLHAGAFQDNGVWVVPLVALTALLAWRAAGEGRTRRAALLGFVSGGLAILLLFTTYYVSYFSVLAAAILFLVALVGWRRRFVAALITGLRTRWVPVATAAVAFAIGLGPFLATYLPAQKAAPSDNYPIALAYAGRLHDLVDVGAGNVVWSSAIHAVLPRMNYNSFEVTYAPTPLIWLLSLGGAAICGWWLWSGRAVRRPAARAAVALGCTALIVALVPLHTRYFTLWAIVYHLPGARAMRAIDRMQIVTGLVACLAAAAAVTEMGAQVAAPGRLHIRRTRLNRTWAGVALVALVALAVVEQLNTAGNSAVNRRTQSALMASVRPAPPGCRSFYVIDSQNPNMPFYEFQVDAMLISQKLRLPTVNGYTAYNPRGWNLEHPGDPDYLASVEGWVQQEGVPGGLCRLDLANMTWTAAGTA